MYLEMNGLLELFLFFHIQELERGGISFCRGQFVTVPLVGVMASTRSPAPLPARVRGVFLLRHVVIPMKIAIHFLPHGKPSAYPSVEVSGYSIVSEDCWVVVGIASIRLVCVILWKLYA